MIVCSLLASSFCLGQNKIMKKKFELWESAVVNIETERYIYPRFRIDSILKSKQNQGYNAVKIDSIKRILSSTITSTGTGLYVNFNNRKYLVTAKHVINDESLVEQKRYEKVQGIYDWDKLEAIAPRISIITPFKYFSRAKQVNNFSVFPNNFFQGNLPYFFISDSTGDGIGVISLQEKNFRYIDTLLSINGYIPINLEDVLAKEKIEVLDEVYAIGFPEMISAVIRPQSKNAVNQTLDIVKSFIVKGTVAMYEENIQHYYVDLTITPGNSGSPIIKDGKLIGIVSGINKYKIRDSDDNTTNLYGIGHLVNIINVKQLKKELELYQEYEKPLLLLNN